MNVLIVGGGASGILLARLLKDLPVHVTLLEKEEHIGKKLLLTGNGKCNFSNATIKKEHYNQPLGYEIASSFDTNRYLQSLGLFTICDDQGRYYPFSMMSNTVLDILRADLNAIDIRCNQLVTKICKNGATYQVWTNKKEVFDADILVLACGGKTYYKEANGYQLASMLSLHITPLRPSLIGIRVDESLASLANLRSKARVTLYGNQQKIYEDSGEILWKSDGLSGIVIFQMSSMINRNPFLNYELAIDLLPQMTEKELIAYLKRYQSLNGLFPKMINQFILRKARSQDAAILAHTIKNLAFSIVDTYDFKNAQVTAGGVSLQDLYEDLSCRYQKNCYIMGELLDIDGICGGYNLQFAFASAYRVFQSIEKKCKEEFHEKS